MSIKAMNWAWSVERLRPAERLVLLALADYADETGSCFPSQDALAERACCSTRTVRRVLDLFEEVGILSRSYRYIEGERSSNRYVLTSDYRTDWPVDDYRTNRAELEAKSDTPGGHPCPTNHQNHQEPPVPPIVPQQISNAFQAFWSTYPKKAGKIAAEKAFEKAVKTVGNPTPILEGARRLRDDPNLPTGAEARFIPHPATWLNQGRWEDDPLPPRGGAGMSASDQTIANLMQGGGEPRELSA